MLISDVTSAIAEDLEALAQLGDDQVKRTAHQLVVAIEPSLRRRILDALNDIVAEINAQPGSPLLELRLAGDDVALVWRDVVTSSLEPPSDLKARVALRLPDEAKSRIEDRASVEGMSVNAWIVRSIQSALEKSTAAAAAAKPGRQLRGTGRS